MLFRSTYSLGELDGTPGTVRTLTNANWIASDWLDAGRFADVYLTVAAVISVQMATVLVMLERRRRDDVNSFFSPALVGTLRLDDPTAAKTAQQTITRAQLVGQSVSAWPAVAPATETLDVVLSTTDQRWAGQCRVLVKATGAPQPTDRLIIAINGGG